MYKCCGFPGTFFVGKNMTEIMDKVTLKDVYQIVSRLEDKVDNRLKTVERKVDELTEKVAEAEGKAKILSWIIPLAVSVGVWIIGHFINR